MLFSLLKHHLDLNITDTALKVSRSLYCFTTSISHGVENFFPRLWGTVISDATFFLHILPLRLKYTQNETFRVIDPAKIGYNTVKFFLILF